MTKFNKTTFFLLTVTVCTVHSLRELLYFCGLHSGGISSTDHCGIGPLVGFNLTRPTGTVGMGATGADLAHIRLFPRISI